METLAQRMMLHPQSTDVDPDTGRFRERLPAPARPGTGEMAKARRARRRVELVEERRRLRDSVEWY